jgi:TonB family protein
MPTAYFGHRVAAGLLGVAIVAAGWSHAPTLHADSSASVQIPTTPVSFASPELDALAANMAKEIVKKKARVVVVGGGGPQNKVTEMGVGLRDAFNESLARQTQGARVLDGAGVREKLRKSRVSEGMLYTDVIAAWIAQHSSAGWYITFRVYGLTGNHASLVAELFAGDKTGSQSNFRASGTVTLTDAHLAVADSDYQPTPNVPGAVEAKSVPKVAKCLVCPYPSYTEEMRWLRISGVVYLDVVVRPDGVADDIVVLKSLGHGLDARAIDAILNWKFEPAKDAQGQAIATHIPIEVAFRLN